jgi:hypothetical protein
MQGKSRLAELKQLTNYLSEQDTVSKKTINSICDIIFTEESNCDEKVLKIKKVLKELTWEKTTKTDGTSTQD